LVSHVTVVLAVVHFYSLKILIPLLGFWVCEFDICGMSVTKYMFNYACGKKGSYCDMEKLK
jgi:hypothetical protein